MKNRKGFMDCARAICTIYIVGFWHLFPYIGKPHANTITFQICYGVLACFTFISGYFLGNKVIDSFRSVFRFYFKRFIAFYPLFLIACVLLVSIGYVADCRQFFLTITGIACFVPPLPATIWYFCMLIIFYLVTPLINVCPGKMKWIVMFSIEVVFVLAMRFGNIDDRLSFYFPFYCAGICAPRKEITCKVNFIEMLLAAIIFIAAYTSAEFEGRILSYISVFSVVIFIICLGRILEKTFVLTIMTKISYASMCAYLFHRPFYTWVRQITGDFPIWITYLGILPVMLIICYGIQWTYDKFVKDRLGDKFACL